MARKICEVCGTYEGTPHRDDCPLRATYSIWIYGPGVGWWLHEEDYDSVEDAWGGLSEAIRDNPEWTGGAVVLGEQFPMPMCMTCLSKASVAKKPKRPVKRGRCKK